MGLPSNHLPYVEDTPGGGGVRFMVEYQGLLRRLRDLGIILNYHRPLQSAFHRLLAQPLARQNGSAS